MRAEILCVGSELLLGQTIDTNAAFIATQLSRAGIDLHRKQTVGDNLERIVDCIRGALSRADALVITGGLGPTTDDMTREGIATALGVPLEHKPELEQELRDFFARRNYTPGATIMRQAYLPQGAQALPNSNGTAPGVLAQNAEGKLVFAVPGVPREMRAMIELSVIPALLERLEGERQVIVSRTLRSFGIGESALAEPIEDILTSSTNPTVAPLLFGKTAEVHLRLTAKSPSADEATQLLDEMEARLRTRVGAHIFGVDEETLAAVVLRMMQERGLTLAVAESLTGGLINTMLTDVPGSSATLLSGVVAYSAAAKNEILNVPQHVIDQDGVVSAATAAAMAEGVLDISGADIGLSTTGEAGPQSASGAPVGTVFIGLSHKSMTDTFERSFMSDRDTNRLRAAMSALDILRRHLQEMP
ncbi:MAG TPA: competence/damage-inducible protein A [Abditibacteriaceae bacterium]|jgi:nicotinamide-nucleotide amidase